MSSLSDPGDPAPSSLSERRSFPRISMSASALMRPASNPLTPARAVMIRNVSQGGINISMGLEVKVGERIILELQTSDGAPPPILVAEVRWIWSDNVSGMNSVGCAWLEPLTTEDLLRFA